MKKLHNLFDSLQEFECGTGQKERLYSLPALEKAGVEFIAENGGGAGVRLKKRGGKR